MLLQRKMAALVAGRVHCYFIKRQRSDTSSPSLLKSASNCEKSFFNKISENPRSAKTTIIIICLNESDYLSGTCSCMTVAAHIDIVPLICEIPPVVDLSRGGE